MLVCNVSLRVRRSAAADLAEAAAAIDFPDTPGLGQLVSEAASAAAVVNAGLITTAAIVEAASAAEASAGNLAGGIAVAVAEAAAATSAQDGAITGAIRLPWAFDLFQQGRWLSAAVAPAASAMSEAAVANCLQDATTTTRIALARTLSASRAGLPSSAIVDDGSGKTQII